LAGRFLLAVLDCCFETELRAREAKSGAKSWAALLGAEGFSLKGQIDLAAKPIIRHPTPRQSKRTSHRGALPGTIRPFPSLPPPTHISPRGSSVCSYPAEVSRDLAFMRTSLPPPPRPPCLPRSSATNCHYVIPGPACTRRMGTSPLGLISVQLCGCIAALPCAGRDAGLVGLARQAAGRRGR